MLLLALFGFDVQMERVGREGEKEMRNFHEYENSAHLFRTYEHEKPSLKGANVKSLLINFFLIVSQATANTTNDALPTKIQRVSGYQGGMGRGEWRRELARVARFL